MKQDDWLPTGTGIWLWNGGAVDSLGAYGFPASACPDACAGGEVMAGGVEGAMPEGNVSSHDAHAASEN